MTRDDLENRSKSELIDLILQQESQIAELQAQLVQLQFATKPDGDDRLPATLPAPGRFPAAFKLILIASGIFACAIALIIVNFKPGATTSAGRAPDFPPGSVVTLQLPRPGTPDQFVPIFVVNDPVVGFLALHGRDPGSNCQMRWVPETGRIEDPCSGSKYTRTGEYISGPSPRSLDRYPITVGENGDVVVDLSTFQPGQPRE
ncbi:MAG TPA: hypothetical protein VJ793_22215 [Anaerolineae bacterium]|nr:hypothetical protein [Anaerolineae bacterium]